MTERAQLLDALAKTIQTYRAGQVVRPSAAHVDRWVSQFTPALQLPFLREFEFVMRHSFLTRDFFLRFFNRMVSSQNLTKGADLRTFWLTMNFLHVQKNGTSQEDMLDLVDECLQISLGINIAACGKRGGDFMYLDDIIFSGKRVETDVLDWIHRTAPMDATLHIVAAMMHSSSLHHLSSKCIPEAIKASGKRIKVYWWRESVIENQVQNKDKAGVLWPVTLPNDVATRDFAARQKFPWRARVPGGELSGFQSEQGRQILENEFMSAGMKIRSDQKYPKDSLRPLGFGQFGIGFGSMLTTYRNCPNNMPLAIWWGNDDENGPFQWYPLLRRITYGM